MGSRLRQMLEQRHFTRDPFSLREVDREGRELISSYFFEHSGFREFLGSANELHSRLLFAQRGAGKTTFRQMIELECRKESRAGSGGVLDVCYTDFTTPLHQLQQHGEKADSTLHVDAILKAAVARLLDTVGEGRIHNFEQLTHGETALLRAYVSRYAAILDPDDYGRRANALLKRAVQDLYAEDAANHLDFDASTLFTADPQPILAELPTEVGRVARWLLRLQQAPPIRLEGKSYMELIRGFLELVLALKYQAMYVLVDRIDEGGMLVEPEMAARFIEPLLTDLTLLDEPGLAFRFLLPRHLENMLTFRRDRIPVTYLAWSDDDMLDLLAQRLKAFSGSTSLIVLCEGSLAQKPTVEFSIKHPKVNYVDLALVQASARLPRNLIRRCRRLFEVYEANDRLGLITEEDLDEAVRTALPGDELNPAPALSEEQRRVEHAASEQIPPHGLYIDARRIVWRDGQRLESEVAPTEFRLLKYLCERRDLICARRDIINAVWGSSYDDSVLRTTLGRLRSAVEENTSSPRFIVTVKGQGLRLEDGRQKSDHTADAPVQLVANSYPHAEREEQQND